MISRLRGTLVGRTPDGFVLDVHGVGYLLAATPSAVRAAEREGEAAVETCCTCARTRSSSGFADGAERQLFLHLLHRGRDRAEGRSRSSPARPPASSPRDRAPGHGALPGDSRRRQEDRGRIVLELKEKLGAEEPVPISAALRSSGTSPRGTRSSSSATPSSRPSRPSPASIPRCRRRSACGSR